MADAPKPQRPRRQRRRAVNPTTEVDVTVDTAPQNGKPKKQKKRRPRRKRPQFGPWLPGQGPRPQTRLRRAIKRELKKEGLEGPKVSVQQRVSSTFGLVGPNSSGGVELELNFFLHPSLAKEANDGTAFGPVQALAAQYALWKLKFLRLHFTPMVGASAVSGTVIRVSLNLSQSPGGTNWSGLGTRIHMDIHPGQSATFMLRGDQLGGPRDGGWWLTDTNEEGSQSAGPIVEVHTLGQTKSTFKTTDWEGPLFIVEGVGMWQFANYQVKPALGMLERHQESVPVTLSATPGEPIMMEISSETPLATFMMNAEPEVFAVPSTNSVGETIFQVVDVGANLASTVLPPPFGWLIKGGWWFLKRVFGKAKAGENKTQFYVYPSLADAQNDRPAIAGASTTIVSQDPVTTELIVTQMNAPNVGPQPTASAMIRANVPVPMEFGQFRIHSEMFPEEIVYWGSPDSSNAYPSSYFVGNMVQNSSAQDYYLQTAWYVTLDTGDKTTVSPPSNNGTFVHFFYKLENPRFSDLTGSKEYIPPAPKSGAALYYGNATQQGVYNKVGEVVATAAMTPGNMDSQSSLGMVFTLVKATKSEPDRLETRGQQLVRAAQGSTSSRWLVKFSTIGATNTGTRSMNFDEGQYLLGITFVASVNNTPQTPTVVKLQQTNVDLGIKLSFNKTTTSNVDSYNTDAFFRLDPVAGIPIKEPPHIPYYLGGNIFPAYSIDMNLNYVNQVVDVDLKAKLLALGVQFQPLAISESSSSSDDSDDEFVTEAARDYLVMLQSMGRLSTRAEIALQSGNYVEALRIHKSE